jgi:hypothetical protein
VQAYQRPAPLKQSLTQSPDVTSPSPYEAFPFFADYGAQDNSFRQEQLVGRTLSEDPKTAEPSISAPSTAKADALGITVEDVVFEQVAHRMVYLAKLDPLDEKLLERAGYDPSTWKLSIGKNGFAAAVVKPLAGSKNLPLVAFRGTEPGKMDDLAADLDPSVIGGAQYNENGEIIAELFASAGRCDVTGHSLGAALGQLAAVDYAAQIRRLVGFQAPAVSKAAAKAFLEKQVRPDVTMHFSKHDLVDNGGAEHLKGKYFLHTPRKFTNPLEAHVDYLLISPQFRALCYQVGLTEEEMDKLDAAHAKQFGVAHHQSKMDQDNPVEVRDERPQPTLSKVGEVIRKGVGTQSSKWKTLMDTIKGWFD